MSSLFSILKLKLIEECSEVQKVLCKIGRFGLHDMNPATERQNVEELYTEFHDVVAAYQEFCDHVGIDWHIDQELVERRKEKARGMLEYSRAVGMLHDKSEEHSSKKKRMPATWRTQPAQTSRLSSGLQAGYICPECGISDHPVDSLQLISVPERLVKADAVCIYCVDKFAVDKNGRFYFTDFS